MNREGHRKRRRLLPEDWMSEISNPVRRPTMHTTWCLCCDAQIRKGKPMVTWYTYQKGGQQIKLCPTCASKIGKLVPDASYDPK